MALPNREEERRENPTTGIHKCRPIRRMCLTGGPIRLACIETAFLHRPDAELRRSLTAESHSTWYVRRVHLGTAADRKEAVRP
jgi:hypothetical protein